VYETGGGRFEVSVRVEHCRHYLLSGKSRNGMRKKQADLSEILRSM
jgi:hypothetical protein